MNQNHHSAQEWAQAHINELLTEQEYLVLSQKIETDKDFAEEFAFLLAASEAMRRKEHEMLNNLVAKPPRKIWGRWFAVAASVLLVSVFAWLLMPDKKTVETIISNYEKAPPIHLLERSSQDSLPFLAERAFNAHEYEAAAEYLGQILEIEETHQIQFYRQQALRLSDQEVDMEVLDNLITSQTYKQKAQWEKVLTLLGQGKREKAKALLHIIKQEKEHPHRKEAQRLLKILK